MKKLLLALATSFGLVACGAEPIWAPDETVAAARYEHSGPTSVTLYTVLSTRSGAGAHVGLLINGSERVLFDPAGTWRHPRLPERNDVHFGITPKMVDFYIDYHARETYDVVEQTIEVSPEVAAMIMQRAMAYGAVPKANCTIALSRCRVAFKSGTLRVERRLLPLNVAFVRRSSRSFPVSQYDPVNCGKKAGLFFKRTKQGNSCVPIEASAEHCRFSQWT